MTYRLILLITLFSLVGCGDSSKNKPNSSLSELDSISIIELSKKSYDYLNTQQEIANNLYKIDKYQNWFYDQYTGELTFSDNGIKKVIIGYEEVGSLSYKSNTWLWAWGNPHLEEKVKTEIGLLKEYGNKRNFKKLTEPKWKALNMMHGK